MFKLIEKYDAKVYKYINSKPHNKLIDKIMIFFTLLGNLGLIWIMISILFISRSNSRKNGIMLLCALLLTTILGEGIIKNIVRRKRPFIKMDTYHKLLIIPPRSHSFPSGHTASSFAASAVFLAIDSELSAIIILIASLIAFSRLYLNVHYLSDIIGGGILGLICGYITTGLFS
ncbi:phosphatase PAP2 family protein [uncultured Clostridium sp.]|uniref:phosphatase PAP2 family protein n=1 Tax=uncultured Clostridium sp. TaxID=59620 RepID=UPI0025D8F6B1|nr:phosphatase PAP2 family protein [uncultured Clostridium sp.]